MGEFLKKGLFCIAQITDINIAKLSRGGIYKTEIQAEMLQNSQEVEVINQSYRQTYYKYSKEKRVLPYTTYSKKDEPTEDEPRKD